MAIDFGTIDALLRTAAHVHDRKIGATRIGAVINSGPLYDPLARAIREVGVPVFRSADSAVRTLGRYLYHKTKAARR